VTSDSPNLPLSTIENRVEKVYEWYQIAMKNIGKNVKWPIANDKKKTYMWRQFDSFVKKCDDLEIDETIMQRLIIKIVKFAKGQKLLNRYASLLNRNDIFDHCYSELIKDLEKIGMLINSAKNIHQFLAEQSGKYKIVPILIAKKDSKSYANITCWHQEGRLADYYIAVSKSCGRALYKIDDDERTQFPKDIEILKLRNKILKDQFLFKEFKRILGNDLADGGI
jgi:hypothetical protein